jgi:hypothetical protein
MRLACRVELLLTSLGMGVASMIQDVYMGRRVLNHQDRTHSVPDDLGYNDHALFTEQPNLVLGEPNRDRHIPPYRDRLDRLVVEARQISRRVVTRCQLRLRHIARYLAHRSSSEASADVARTEQIRRA